MIKRSDQELGSQRATQYCRYVKPVNFGYIEIGGSLENAKVEQL
jgi:hypothetical protein